MDPDAVSTRVDEEPMEVSGDEENMHLNDSEDPAANISFQVPQTIEEPSLEDAVPNDISYVAEDGREVEYTVVENGSQKGLKLADSNGYTYTVKKRRKNGQIDWACSIRNKVVFFFVFFFFMNGNTERAQCALSQVCIP